MVKSATPGIFEHSRRPAHGLAVALIVATLLSSGCGRVTVTQAALSTKPLGGAVTNSKLTAGGSAGLGTVDVTSNAPGALHGRVLNAALQPVAGATVVNAQTGQKVTTDNTGTYRFTGLPEGNYTFSAMATGLVQETPAGILAQGNMDTAVPDITLVPGNGPSGITSLTYTQEAVFGNVGGATTLKAPVGVAVSGQNTLVLDTSSNLLGSVGAVRQFTSSYAFQGSFGDYTEWLGLHIMADTVNAIAVDGTKRAWVLDPANSLLWAFDTDGNQTNKVTIDGTDATSLAIDPSNGAMYLAGGGVTKLDGEGGNPQKMANAGDARAVAAGFNAVWALVDTKAVKLAADGSTELSIGPGGAKANDAFSNAKAIAVDPRNGNVIVADGGTKNVFVYDNGGVLIGKVGDGVLQDPIALSTDNTGRVFILDGASKKVYKYLQSAVH